MLPLRFPWVWWSLGWLLVAGVVVASLLPGPWVPSFSLRDKFLHAATYCLLMIWFSGLYRRGRHVVVALLLLALGFALDAAQSFLSTRSFEMADVAANAGGILIGLVLARFVFEGWCRRVESWFFS